MKEYVRFSGSAGAFGWATQQENVCAVALGGLKPGAAYLLLTEQGNTAFVADGRGAWRGMSAQGVPLAVATAQGELALYDDGRISPVAAVLLVRERLNPPPAPACQMEKDSPAPAEEQIQPAAESSEDVQQEAPVHYRAISDQAPVDALPALLWPGEAEKLRPFFQKNRPVRLFDWPGWRFVAVQMMDGAACHIGVRMHQGRVEEVMYAVQARGGMIAPRGLAGYRYQRAADGRGHWVMQRKVQL